MTARPKVNAKSQLCLYLSEDGLTVYGNKESMRSLARQLNWIANAPPEDSYECHVRLTFETGKPGIRMLGEQLAWVNYAETGVKFFKPAPAALPSDAGSAEF